MLETSLPRDAYVDDDVWQLEKAKIFGKNWFCIGRDGEIDLTAGSYRLIDLFGESVIVMRGGDGKLRAFVNMCRHRGTELIDTTVTSEQTGCVGALIRCPYHSWTYNNDGSLRGAPHLDDIDPAKFGLIEIGLEAWGGFVFVRKHSGVESVLDGIGEIAERLRNYPLSDLVVKHSISYQVAANWKVLCENYNECYHCGPVHPELCEVVPAFRAGGANDLNWDDGIPHREGAYTFTKSGTTIRKPFPGLSDAEKVKHKGELIYPNLFLSLACDHVAAFYLWPSGPASTTIVCDFLFHRDEVRNDTFDSSDAVEFWDVVNRQDWAICERVQRGMNSEFFIAGLFAPMENPSLDIRQWWRSQVEQ